MGLDDLKNMQPLILAGCYLLLITIQVDRNLYIKLNVTGRELILKIQKLHP